MSRKITCIYHSQKLVDEQVIRMLSSLEYYAIQFLNLANAEISIKLLKEVTSKLSNWQRTLLDIRYMDHSIRDPEQEFLLMDDSSKILFLKNNSWLIGTPLVIDNDRAFRFKQVADVMEWLNAINISRPKELASHSIEVLSSL